MKLIERPFAVLGAFLAAALAAGAVRAADFVNPEAALYVTHSAVFRSRFSAGFNYHRNDGTFATGSFEYDLDVGLLPFFRRYVFKDPNVEKGQRLTARMGLAHISDLKNDDDPADENRGILELTGRFPFGGTWLLSDRNKGDFRWVDGVYSSRYRNRLRLEHSVKRLGFKFSPYANAEAYYDFNDADWSRADFTLGAEFPLKFGTVFEMYYTHAETVGRADQHYIGIVFQKHMAGRILGGS